MRQRIDELIERYGIEPVIDATRPLLSDRRVERIENVLGARLGSVTVAIEDLYDPHNGAAAIRSLESLGLQTMHVVERSHRFGFSPGVTIGCHKWIDVHKHGDIASCTDALRRRGFTLWAAVPGAEHALADIDVSTPCALVFGNEHEGLTAEAVQACDRAFSIPMVGFTQSFNLSVSVAVALHDVASRRRRVLDAMGDLEEAERAYLRARWYALSVRHAEHVIERYASEMTQSDVGQQTRQPDNH